MGRHQVAWVRRRVAAAVAAVATLLGLGVFLFGPVVALLAIVGLTVPRVRSLVTARRMMLGAGLTVLALALPVVAVWFAPPGSLPIPPGPGLLLSPSVVRGPAFGQNTPVGPQGVQQNPFLSANGTNSMHNDAFASDSYAGAGPTGRAPIVDTAWYGLRECATLTFNSEGRLVALCGDLRGPSLHLIDPDSLRVVDSATLPPRPPSDVPAWKDLCAGAYSYLDNDDRAVVATTDQRILRFATRGDRLAMVDSVDLSGDLPAGSCLVALLPDWAGRVWFVTDDGIVGFVDTTGDVATLQLPDEKIANSFAVDVSGVYVVTDHALYAFSAGSDGQPTILWRRQYDRGSRTKTGQLSQGSGTTPTLFGGDLVGITDNADPRMHVVVINRRTGEEVCDAAVFGYGHSATENTLVAIDGGLIVENNYGYDAPWSTLGGRGVAGGLARVDVSAAGTCKVSWTSPEIAPTSVPKASVATGLVYAYTERPSRLGVTSWYLTGIDVRSGRTAFSVRTGTGPLFNNHYSAVTLGPDGSAYVATLAGLVRIRDGQ